MKSSLFVTMILAGATLAQAQAPAPQGDRRVASVNTAPRVDVTDVPRPIDMHTACGSKT